jgi:hypothetical protein
MGKSINDLEEFKDSIYSHRIYNEYLDLLYGNMRPATERIARAAFNADNLRELLAIINTDFSIKADNLSSLLNLFTTHNKLENESLPRKMLLLHEEYLKYKKEFLEKPNPYDSYTVENMLIDEINKIIKTINKNIEFSYNSIKNVESSDVRLNKATMDSLFKEYDTMNYDTYIGVFNQCGNEENKLNAEHKDIFSKESIQLTIKKLRIFKAGVIASFNKYFGKNSDFAELDLFSQLS